MRGARAAAATAALWARIAVLGAAYALIRLLGCALRTPRRAAASAGLALLALLGVARLERCAPRRPLRVATYNIRRLGVEPTDMARLADIVAALEADVLAVQEVQDERPLGELARRASRGRRRYAHVVAACGGRSGMSVGFVYDTRRVRLRALREYPELDPEARGSCTAGDRAALLGVFDDGRRALHLLNLHLSARGDAERAARRREQWARTFRIVARLRAEGAAAVVVLGDVNSTGYLDNAHGEREFIHDGAAAARLDLLTAPLGCSEYWAPRPGLLAPSLLDHALATPGLARPDSTRVHGYCEALACRAHQGPEAPADYLRVSDHCPVAFDLAR